MVTAEPTALLRDGRLDEEALLRQRLSRSEVQQAVRASGVGDIGRVGAVALETDGTRSVVPVSAMGDASALPAERAAR